MKENKNLKLKSICHSELVSESMKNKEYHTAGFRIKSGMTESEEQGRSMVEMLGVLAVIGVLSVAGIAGYTIAMNKYRANELLNEASKRAVVLAMQITQGKTGTLSIDEFINNKIGTAEFTNPSYTAGASTFTMTLTGVNETVCNQMKAATGENSSLKIEGTCGDSLTLTFTKDLSSGGDSSSDNSCKGVKCGSNCCPSGSSCGTNNECTCEGELIEGANGTPETICCTSEVHYAQSTFCCQGDTPYYFEGGSEYQICCAKNQYFQYYLQDYTVSNSLYDFGCADSDDEQIVSVACEGKASGDCGTYHCPTGQNAFYNQSQKVRTVQCCSGNIVHDTTDRSSDAGVGCCTNGETKGYWDFDNDIFVCCSTTVSCDGSSCSCT